MGFDPFHKLKLIDSSVLEMQLPQVVIYIYVTGLS